MKRVTDQGLSFDSLSGLFISLALLSTGCASAKFAPGDPIPLWAQSAGRSASSGQISFVESEDAPSAEVALKNAQTNALADIANECSFVPNNLKIGPVFEHLVGHLHEAYIMVTVEASSCQRARLATTSTTIDQLADKNLMSQLIVQQNQLGETSSRLSSLREKDAQIPADETDYLLVREQFAYAKETILARTSPSPDIRGVNFESDTKPDQDLERFWQSMRAYEDKNASSTARQQAWVSIRHRLFEQKVNMAGHPLEAVDRPKPDPNQKQTNLTARRHRHDLGGKDTTPVPAE